MACDDDVIRVIILRPEVAREIIRKSSAKAGDEVEVSPVCDIRKALLDLADEGYGEAAMKTAERLGLASSSEGE